jgi:putative NADH-flavin reductase
MKILIFGASGSTGRHLVSQALGQQYSVTAFVRNPSKLRIRHRNIHVFQGDVSDARDVEKATENQDAVLSALGASSPFKRDDTLIKGVRNIVTAMKNQNVKRFIYQSFLGVSENRKELGFLLGSIVPIFLRNVIRDHEAKEDIIIKSDLDWTVVRCAMLTNGTFTGSYSDGEHITSASILPAISRADVADYMLKQLADKRNLRKKPRIMH